MKKITGLLSLFGSLSTLLCCALPVALVSLGMGATFASLTSTFPQMIWVAEKKDILFLITGVLLFLSYFFMRRSKNEACPIDQKENCGRARNFSHYVFYFSLVMYIVGLSFSYIIPRVIYG